MNAPRIALLAAVIAVAGGCATTMPDTRHSTSNGDGSNSDAAFAALDTNNDGSLGVDELEAEHAVGLLRDLHNAGSDHDGAVSRSEWNAWWPVMTHTEASPTMAALNASAAPTDGIRANR